MVHANLLARVVRLFVKIPRLISTAHNTREGGRIRMLAYRLTDGLADISTNVSEEAVESFISAGAVKPGRMIALHNSVDIRRFQFRLADRVRIRSELGCPDGVKVLLAVGRLHEQKDYPMLFRALKLIDENSNYVLWIAGEGSLRSELQALAKNLGIEERVLFLGIRDDVSALMSAANIFVFPSAYEGFGLVVAEAMACERVVVATNSGGVKEVLGECGFLVPPQNPELFAQGVKRALALSPENSLSLGKIARKRVSEFYSFEAALCKWIALYEKKLPLQVKRAV
jgi:glycosyltransferase involved in cell wall biosynthesis